MRQLEVGAPWPKAACGVNGKRWSVDVSMWPVRGSYTHLSDVVDLEAAAPLSERAAAGFSIALREVHCDSRKASWTMSPTTSRLSQRPDPRLRTSPSIRSAALTELVFPHTNDEPSGTGELGSNPDRAQRSRRTSSHQTRFALGTDPCSGHRCQKQPSTKTAPSIV